MENRSLKERFEVLLVPERELSIKLIFDNIRNYLLCAALFGVSLWFERGSPGMPRSPNPSSTRTFEDTGYWAFATLGITLVLLNLLQTFQLLGRGLVWCRELVDELDVKGPSSFFIAVALLWGPLFFALWFLMIVVPLFLLWFGYTTLSGKAF